MSRQVASYIDSQTESKAEVVITRPAATSLFCIDSDDRYKNYLQRRLTPTYPFSFGINKNESLLNGFFNRMALTEFRLNWTLPNIATPWGNNVMTIHYKVGAGADTVGTIIVPDGFYGAEEIANELQNLIRTFISGFLVKISDKDDDVLTFVAPTNTTFFFASQGTATRELCDLLNVPTQVYNGSNTYLQDIQSGIPNLRPMDYFDIVCNQLTYNQDLKDSTSAPIVRDMIARIYLDDAVPSQAVFNTNYYSNTQLSTAISGSSQVADEVLFTVTSSTGFTVDSQALIGGITGGTGWNDTVEVIEIPDSTHIRVLYATPPTGTPSSYSGATIKSFAFTQFSTPQTTWDDRINGVTPFVMYRQFPYPKQIRWNKKMPIGQVQFELYDDQGRSIQDLWKSVYPITPTGLGLAYANSFVWNMSLLVTED
jgi:hypothetical protein